jgi:hypothetical protein
MVVRGQELHRIRDGNVAETWICDDVPSIMVQLGATPSHPAGGPPHSTAGAEHEREGGS